MGKSKKKKKTDRAATALVKERWAKATPEQRTAIARKLNEARWGKKKNGNGRTKRVLQAGETSDPEPAPAVPEVPPVDPYKPAAEASNAIYIMLGRKRYKIHIQVSAEELKPKPAPLMPIK